jgi:hypothetical protein
MGDIELTDRFGRSLSKGGGRGTRRLPMQDQDKVLLMAERFSRSKLAQDEWAPEAKKCVEYFEGKQWSAEDIAKLLSEGRPVLTLNKIKPLITLILGYHANNRNDINYLPGTTGTGDASTAECLNALSKQVAEQSGLEFIDIEVFLDGALTGRGFYDGRLNFDKNIYGELVWKAADPFSTYLDPDGDQYDLNESGFVCTTRRISPDEIEYWYGQEALAMIGPFFQGRMLGNLPTDYSGMDEITPERRFGLETDPTGFSSYAGYYNDWVDPYRKTVRMVDMQHWVRCRKWTFVDLDTGAIDPVPEEWTEQQAQAAIEYAAAQGRPQGLMQVPAKRLRWTHVIGDIIVYDDWSPYRMVTTVPFFPYFRRGKTRGLVHDLLSPQDEINKRRASRMNIVNRSSNGGWMYEKHSLDPQVASNLRLHGAKPGVNIPWNSHGGKYSEPKQIQPPVPPESIRQLEQEAEADLKEISGVNEAALGQVDKVVSGKNLQNRTAQALVGLETVMVNLKRTKEIQGRKQLDIFQNFYTEQRIIRVRGTGENQQEYEINKRSADAIIHDVTLGEYSVAIDQVPLSESFLRATFDELIRMKTEVGLPIPDDVIIRNWSGPGKEELVASVAAERQAQEAAAQAGGAGGPGQPPMGPGPGGSQVGPDGGSLPAGGPPGAGNVVPMRQS